MSLPKIIHHIEGLTVFTICLILYFQMHESDVLLAALILAPDIGMLGYFVNAKVGSYTYNILHTYLWPLLLGFVGVMMGYETIPIALIWAAHIGGDRALGYGLKYPTRFQDVDLQRL